jgi:ATP-dependent DNA helicase RecG
MTHTQQLIDQGENAQIEFKSAQVRPDSVAREIVSFANTLGGTLLIGIEDNGTVSGIDRDDYETWLANISRNNIMPALQIGISRTVIDDKTVYVVEVPKGKDKPYQTLDGKYWLRVGSTNRTATKEELSRLFQQAGLIHFDTAPVADTGREGIDNQLVHTYYHTYYKIDFLQLEASEQQNLLLNADIITEREGKQPATIGGLLMFGKQPQRRLPHSSIMFAVFNGTDLSADLVNKKEILGTLPELIDKTVSLLQLFLPTASLIKGTQREEKELIPLKVLRESMVNAVVHRDYSLSMQKIQVHVFSDRIEITSPGKLTNTLTLMKIRYGNSSPRNIFLIKYLDNMRYFDGLGRGIPMMLHLMGDRIIFTEIGELFRVTLEI